MLDVRVMQGLVLYHPFAPSGSDGLTLMESSGIQYPADMVFPETVAVPVKKELVPLVWIIPSIKTKKQKTIPSFRTDFQILRVMTDLYFFLRFFILSTSSVSQLKSRATFSL